MKSLPCLLAAALAAGTLRAAVPAPARPAVENPFAQVSRDYKKPQEVPETFFNPFKIETAPDLSAQKKNGVAVSGEIVAEAVGRRGVSGIIYAAEPGANRVIIGDQVFRIGDELDFPDGDKGVRIPLVAGTSVILREVGAKSLVFDFGAQSEPSRRASYPLRTFWRP